MLNLGKILNRKVVFIFVVVLILCVVGGFFWWQNREIKGSQADYVVKETAEGKIVENKKAGLTVEVPEGWEIKKMETEEGLMTFFPLETEMEIIEGKIVLPIKKGCLIRTTIVYREGNLDQIKKETTIDHVLMGGTIYDDFEEVMMNNYYGIKNVFESEKFGSGTSIYIPIKNKVYGFHLVWASDEKERCVQEFDKFLETVSIQ